MDFSRELNYDDIVRLAALGAVALVAGVLLLARWMRRRFLRRLLENPPPRVRLERLEPGEIAWRNRRAASGFLRGLHALGFEDAGTFGVAGRKDWTIHAAVNVKEGLNALIQERTGLGVWLDVSTRYADGSRVLYTTNPKLIGAGQPGLVLKRMPRADAARVVQAMLAERPSRPVRPVLAEEYPAHYERAYAEAIDWLAARGGFTETQVRNSLRLWGRELSVRWIDKAMFVLGRKALRDLDRALREYVGRVAGLSAVEFETVQDRILCIHDRLTLDDVVDAFNLFVPTEHAVDAARPVHARPRAAFQAMNTALPKDLRYHKLGTTDHLIRADVYCPPDGPVHLSLEEEVWLEVE